MEPIQGPRQFPHDCMPREDSYNSRDEVYAALNAWAAPRGYAFVVGRSRKRSNGRETITYMCDRGAGRIPSSSQPRQRLTTTRRTGCKFSILATEAQCRTQWVLKHRDGHEFNTHNHEPSLHQTAHPIHRQLSSIDRSLVQGMAEAGIAPKEIRSYLRTQLNTNATQ